jgi:hypothetical protein
VASAVPRVFLSHCSLPLVSLVWWLPSSRQWCGVRLCGWCAPVWVLDLGGSILGRDLRGSGWWFEVRFVVIPQILAWIFGGDGACSSSSNSMRVADSSVEDYGQGS